MLAGKGDSGKAAPLKGQPSSNTSDGVPNGEDRRRQQQHGTQQPSQLNGTAVEQRPSAKQQHPQQQLQVNCGGWSCCQVPAGEQTKPGC